MNKPVKPQVSYTYELTVEDVEKAIAAYIEENFSDCNVHFTIREVGGDDMFGLRGVNTVVGCQVVVKK